MALNEKFHLKTYIIPNIELRTASNSWENSMPTGNPIANAKCQSKRFHKNKPAYRTVRDSRNHIDTQFPASFFNIYFVMYPTIHPIIRTMSNDATIII